MKYMDSENFRRSAIFLTLAVVIGLFVALPGDCSASWPFTSKPYIAKVDGKVITSDDFSQAIKKLHMSGRVGKAIKEKEGVTAAQDYAIFLEELIDDKLMVIEVEKIGLDKERDVVEKLDNYILNLFLRRLHQEEVAEKVKVEESEIDEYFSEQLRKEEEERALDEGKEEALDEVEKKEAGVKEEDGEEKEGSREMTAGERQEIKRALMVIKSKEREEEFFSQLRAKAKIEVDEEVLIGLSTEKPELMRKAVAHVNGEAVTGKDLFITIRGKVPEDLEERKKALDRLILFKLLDSEAMSRGYEKDPELKGRIESYREKVLIEQFKKKVIPPLVKVEEEEILGYYDDNKEQFREFDRIDLKGIRAVNLGKAREILEELKAGADFSFLAREESLAPSGKKGGVLGKVTAGLFSADALEAFRKAAEGDILGPFLFNGDWWVFEFHGIEKGTYLPLENVRNKIYMTLGKQMYDAMLKTYLERLRASVSVDINEAELKRLEGK